MSADMEEAEGTSAAGCMCAVLQLFDLHQFQIPLNNHDPFLQEEATVTKGVEAPRNSLETEGPAAMKAASVPSSAPKEEENLNFPVGIQIKTRVSTSDSGSRTEDFPSESSPGIKTPNLVARLMGLDLLPECTSPSFSSSDSRPRKKSQFNQRNILHTRFFDDDISVGARSLPETPRISSARRSDVEFHRLSLQINKDQNTNEEFSLSAKMVGRQGLRFRQDENRSPGHYAKQIVKQVKESVSRRVVGLDITNINRYKQEIRRDENLLLFKPTNTNSQNLPPLTNSGNKSPRISQGILSPLNPKNQEIVQENQHQKESCKRVGSGNSNSSFIKKFPQHQACNNPMIRKKKEEPFVRSSAANKANLTDKKSKKAPLSSELLSISSPALLPVKKDPSPPATKLPQKQSQVSDALSSKRSTQLSSNPSHSYKQLHLQPHKISTVPENVLPDKTNGCATTSSAAAWAVAAEYKPYIQRILKRTGIIDKVTPLTLGKWHTPSHPLDPSIFYYLELFHPSAATLAVLSRRCNRKLIFQLVDELLAEILRPHLDFKPWVSPITDHLSLADELCKKIESFPAANCQVLEDIDSLIEKDLGKSGLNWFLEEEGESLVCEIEGEIMESLVRETVAMVGVRTAEEQRRKPTDFTWRAFT
ncbi:uncharacterized protein LOC105179248 isoform X1 [Sesamum indicum]|uniref:Uncharacterized protein LOC105179248 isoform X1 n=1 Tax=Sesamum indicum TaxID=4182 RepID=A0A6I9UP03_SESIN|nr:uncharacterized protein LOC105179248 isoform X1 [Sesamum indicum]